MTERILFLCCMYLLLPILYFCLRYEAKARGNVLFGVTVPKEYIQDRCVQQIINRYRKRLKVYGILFAVAPVWVLFIPYFSIVYMVLMIWFLLVITVYFGPFVMANKELLILKKEKGWSRMKEYAGYKEPACIKEEKRYLTKKWFIITWMAGYLPVIFALVKLIQGKVSFSSLNVIFAISHMTLLFGIFGIFASKITGKNYCKDQDINQRITANIAVCWQRGLLAAAALSVIYTYSIAAGLYLNEDNILYALIVTVFYTLFLIAILLVTGGKVYQIEREGMTAIGTRGQRDQDENWMFGMFYYNNEDSHLFVDKHSGMGWTFNFARPAARVLSGIAIILFLLLPLSGINLMIDEFVPISIIIEEQDVVVKQCWERYRVDQDNIKSIELLTSLPELTKDNGTSIENLKIGSFTSEVYGSCDLCMNPLNTYYLLIKTEEETYLFTDDTDQGTREIYNRITK